MLKQFGNALNIFSLLLAIRRENLLGLHLVEGVDLFTHLGNGIVVLLAKVGQDGLVLDVGLF